MILNLRREILTDESTIGRIYRDGSAICWTLEDKVREQRDEAGKWFWRAEFKIYGRTAIPAGRYQVVISYSNRFRRPLPLLIGVPDFSGVRIHPGNTASDTEGCILVGTSHGTNTIYQSRVAFDSIMPMLRMWCETGKLYLVISN